MLFRWSQFGHARDVELTVKPGVIEGLLAEAGGALPEEACGLLLGRSGVIEQIRPTRNVHPARRTSFEIDPQALVDAHRAARQGGAQVLGYYHSHPAGQATPSATDRAMAAGDGRVWAIIYERDVTFWCDDEGGFAALSYIVEDG